MTTEKITNEPTTWQDRLDVIVDLMRDMSRHTDPQEMVRSYGEKIQQLMTIDRRLSISRRGLDAPHYRVTRSTTWSEEINPWTEKDRLPLFQGGLLGRLIHGDDPVLIHDLELDADEPAREFLEGHRSLLAVPMYDQGEALNMVILLQRESHAFDHEQIPDLVWRSNLFGRATNNLVLKEELRRAYRSLDLEMKAVGEIQRSLLPIKLPNIPTLDLASHYQPAQRAGGDYYDFFRRRQRTWNSRRRCDGRDALYCPYASRSPVASWKAAGLPESSLVRTVRQPKFHIRDGVLWHLRSSNEAADLFLCGTQSSATEAVSGWYVDFAGSGGWFATGNCR